MIERRAGGFARGSLSLRRAWIEIPFLPSYLVMRACRSPYGERGLKYRTARTRLQEVGVALLTESVD